MYTEQSLLHKLKTLSTQLKGINEIQPTSIKEVLELSKELSKAQRGVGIFPESALQDLLSSLDTYLEQPNASLTYLLIERIEEICRILAQNNMFVNNMHVEVIKKNTTQLYNKALIIDSCHEDGAKLVSIINKCDYDAVLISNTNELSAYLHAHEHSSSPLIVILKWNDAVNEPELLRKITEIKSVLPANALLLLMCQAIDIQFRLKVLRTGVDRYIRIPNHETYITSIVNSVSDMKKQSPYRALIVDDNKIFLRLYADLLKSQGFETYEFLNPMEVLEHLEKMQPDVIILDYHMPDIMGPELAILLREQPQYVDVPIVFISADTDYTSQLYALKTGADDFLLKPVENEHFCASVLVRARRYRLKATLKENLQKEVYERDKEHQAINSHAIVSITDKKGDIIYVNDYFCQISGYTKEEIIGKNHRLIKSNVHDEAFYREIWSTIKSGKTWRGDICNKQKEGGLYWVNSTITPMVDKEGKPYQYISIRTDITANKMLQQALQAMVISTSTTIGTEFFEQTTQGLTLATGATTSFISVPTNNPGIMKAISLFHEGELLNEFEYELNGTPCEQVKNNEICFYKENVHNQFPKDTFLKSNNIEAYIAVPLISAHGERLGHIGLMSDKKLFNSDYIVSLLSLFADRVCLEMLRLRNEAMLVQAKEEADRANRAKSEFLSNMSHELRTPLNAILGFGQLLEASDSIAQSDLEDVDEILKASRHLLHLINEILDLSKVEAGKFNITNKTTDVTQIVAECTKLIAAQCAEKTLTLHVEQTSKVFALCDPLRLKQVLINLLSNAVKYNRSNGEVCISVSSNDYGCSISVADTGVGMTEQDLEKIYEPFNRLGAEDSETEGTGIGLTLTKKLVELMNGELLVESELNVGSTFTIMLLKEQVKPDY
ncbi:Sensor histidine kinase RcsC [Pseudoalteromonas sp. CIP111854]|uniref:histidine kinase n=1 Tax=Pseudoalteromonas holothuriae TaxID=2963714 RepID=A0A9W4QUJ4_9GAMM|nr:ATP-binding protein [Pseudoalteromonas sp. CIP111854]CAH9053882.1 Sensor histidine kinase RcsC [Pseudoalteromonas sp. CIP111854]